MSTARNQETEGHGSQGVNQSILPSNASCQFHGETGDSAQKTRRPAGGGSAGFVLWRQQDEEKLRHPVKQEERRCCRASFPRPCSRTQPAPSSVSSSPVAPPLFDGTVHAYLRDGNCSTKGLPQKPSLPYTANQRNGKELINLLLSPFLSFFSLLEAGAPQQARFPRTRFPRSVLEPLQ